MSDQQGLVRSSPIELDGHEWPAGAFDGVVFARSVAYIADLVLISFLILVATIVFGILGILTLGLLWPGAALSPLIGLAYFTLSLGGPNSATPGMRWQGIELRTWDGRRPGYLQGALQTLLFYVSVTVGTLLVLLVPFFNTRRRCLHDYLCGTVVIRREFA
ncbi:MAG: RDD family protein [Parvibaculum sp.]|jgi:uncharacterized RDD family membrane protein YckC|uniref:RDD family protein n=1 Tax=Parvibaculum sp. TaxID=2024848 RepID=UPI00284BFE6A|nr:RDD family protein [Parvibaculum sp.]MDR3499973.1 RDD family protein [Parvibaculum sp.]